MAQVSPVLPSISKPGALITYTELICHEDPTHRCWGEDFTWTLLGAMILPVTECSQGHRVEECHLWPLE
jgi:hypothetical protein